MGSLYGLADQVDVGNRDHGDNAFVFAAAIDAGGLTAAEYGQRLADVAAHEAGPLLGAAHAGRRPERQERLRFGELIEHNDEEGNLQGVKGLGPGVSTRSYFGFEATYLAITSAGTSLRLIGSQPPCLHFCQPLAGA
jgi:hypothetical protein